MSEESEFEKYRDKCVSENYGSTECYENGILDGMTFARDYLRDKIMQTAKQRGTESCILIRELEEILK